MNKAQSNLLDIFRAFAAILVVVHHFDRVFLDATYLPRLGQEAVVIFLVLSGYVISYVVDVKEKSIKPYLLSRLSRLYSVILPSLFLLLILFAFGFSKSPDTYLPVHPDSYLFLKTLMTLSFANYNDIHELFLPTGRVYWSLAIEFWCYFVFACFYFTHNRLIRFISLLLFLIFVGIKGLLFGFIWWLGVLLYKYKEKTEKLPGALLVSLGGIGFLWLYFSELRWGWLDLGELTFSYLSHARYILYFYLISFTFCFIFIGMMNLLSNSENAAFRRIVKPIAASSFFMYLSHMPILYFLYAMGVGEVLGIYTLPIVIIMSVMIGLPIEKTKNSYKVFFEKCYLLIEKKWKV